MNAEVPGLVTQKNHFMKVTIKHTLVLLNLYVFHVLLWRAQIQEMFGFPPASSVPDIPISACAWRIQCNEFPTARFPYLQDHFLSHSPEKLTGIPGVTPIAKTWPVIIPTTPLARFIDTIIVLDQLGPTPMLYERCLASIKEKRAWFFCETQGAPLHLYSIWEWTQTQGESRDLKDNKWRDLKLSLRSRSSDNFSGQLRSARQETEDVSPR